MIDNDLLTRFNLEIKAKVPHFENEGPDSVIVNATPLVDLTSELKECARVEFGLDLPSKSARVYCKFDSRIFTGSVKVRPAVQIIEDAIRNGKLTSGRTVFEATSGNFGISLGLLKNLGLDVIVLVSRKLQSGVLDDLEQNGVKQVNLDIDICPAPGLKMDPNLLLAKTTAANVRQQLDTLGLDMAVFDSSRREIEEVLGRQDVIGLSKVLARIYQGFCPEQYDNELNVQSHETVTGPEIDQQMTTFGHSLGDFGVLSAFGTGGTSTGLSRFVQKKYGRKTVHVIFPLGNQDVAGIRTREKALGLRFYQPDEYSGVHEVDFQPAKRVHKFFAKRGYDIGESSALVLYACLQMLNFGVGDKFVVMIADGLQKYARNFEAQVETLGGNEVTLEDASKNINEYAGVLWTHAMYVPNEKGVELIASSLRCDAGKVSILRASDVQSLVTTQEVPETVKMALPKERRRVLLVCMVGGTSLNVAQVLARKGIRAESLTGGIIGLSEATGQSPPDLLQIAAE